MALPPVSTLHLPRHYSVSLVALDLPEALLFKYNNGGSSCETQDAVHLSKACLYLIRKHTQLSWKAPSDEAS